MKKKKKNLLTGLLIGWLVDVWLLIGLLDGWFVAWLDFWLLLGDRLVLWWARGLDSSLWTLVFFG